MTGASNERWLIVLEDCDNDRALIEYALAEAGITNVEYTDDPLDAIKAVDRDDIHSAVLSYNVKNVNSVELYRGFLRVGKSAVIVTGCALDLIRERHPSIELELISRDNLAALVEWVKLQIGVIPA